MLRRRARAARARRAHRHDRHRRAVPGDARDLARRSSSASASTSRSRTPTGDWTGPAHCCGDAQGRRARARARAAPTPGSPASAASSRRRARTRSRSSSTTSAGIWKYNPLVDWTEKDLWRRIAERDLPYHPLHDQGYASIGCAPCTQPGQRAARAAGPGCDQDRVRAARHVTADRHARALAPARARGRGDPRDARGRRRAREARAAVQRRQGLDRARAARAEGVRAGPRPVPAAAHRHRPQLPRGASRSATGSSPRSA